MNYIKIINKILLGFYVFELILMFLILLRTKYKFKLYIFAILITLMVYVIYILFEEREKLNFININYYVAK